LEKYQRSTLLQEEDIEEDAQSDLQERMQSVLKERKNNIDPGMQSKRVTQEEDTRDNFNEIFDAAYNSATKGKGNDDDSLMHRFFDNQEETPME
jgi:predicted N-acyltransferase